MRKLFKPIYIEALIVYLFYSLTGKYLLVKGTISGNPSFSFFVQSLASSIFAVIFLFLFSHEEFFKFARVIEKKESKKEKRYIKKYLHFGKHLAVLIIGVLAGPLFA